MTLIVVKRKRAEESPLRRRYLQAEKLEFGGHLTPTSLHLLHRNYHLTETRCVRNTPRHEIGLGNTEGRNNRRQNKDDVQQTLQALSKKLRVIPSSQFESSPSYRPIDQQISQQNHFLFPSLE